MDIASSLLVPDWSRGSIQGNQGVVIAETGFKYQEFSSRLFQLGFDMVNLHHPTTCRAKLQCVRLNDRAGPARSTATCASLGMCAQSGG